MPYRSLLPKKIENLLMAGKCVSADSKAMASIRIQPLSIMTGEAAGVIAATAIKKCTSVRNVDIKQIQNILIARGVRL